VPPQAKHKRFPKRLRAFSVLRLLALTLVYTASAALALAYYVYGEFARTLPEDLTALHDEPTRASRVYSADGELIGEFYLQRRIVVPLERIPHHVQRAFISAEDRRFWEHPGFDVAGIARAAWVNYQGGATRQGASTITQQVTRMLMLSTDRTYERKLRELILSIRVERELSKHDILAIYLNRAYLGHGAYGVQAAAETYFGKDVEHLTVAEAALIAGMPQAPSRYSPYRNYGTARWRQRYVIERMHQDGYLTAEEARAAMEEPLALVDDKASLNHVAAPHFVERVRDWAQRTYGHQDVFHGGLRIFTTLDTRMQRSAEAAVRDGIDALDRRLGFRGPIGHLEEDELEAFRGGPPHPYVPGMESAALGGGAELLPGVAYVGVVVGLPGPAGVVVDAGPQALPMERDDARGMRNWRGEGRVRLAVGDRVPVAIAEQELPRGRGTEPVFRLAQSPDVEAALVAVEPDTGRIRAMVGGYDYGKSEFNRAAQARRQIGSAIKPFIYAAALDNGRTQLDVIRDEPVSVRTAGGVWSPGNFGLSYEGAVTLRTALARSLNTISVKLTLEVGVEPIIELMRRLGITSPFTHHITLSLGTPDLTLLEVTGAYAAFINGGFRVTPRYIDLVTTEDGVILEDYRRDRARERAISPQLAYLVADMMKAVVDRGTGRGAQVLGRPAGGKTGTSTNYRDAWFIGFTADFVAGVWVGRDDFTPIGRRVTGGATALPIWRQFMLASHPDTPVRDLSPPDGITFVRANELSGEPEPPGSPRATWIPFARGTVPSRFADRQASEGFRSLRTEGDTFR
jgi:penicillin-binding protein 1A